MSQSPVPEASRIGIGLIGTGYMGKCHALAYNSVYSVFGGSEVGHLRPKLEVLCDVPLGKAQEFTEQFGFASATDSWEDLIADPRVEIVCITAPNKVHREIAVTALKAGKHVHLEKPMALTIRDVRMMRDLSLRPSPAGASPKTIVGYQYLKNPAFTHAQRLIASGAIGKVIHFRGAVDEDYQADPNLPWSWRATKRDAGLGTLGDLGCHLVSLAHNLVGSPVTSLVAEMQTVHRTRPVSKAGQEVSGHSGLAAPTLSGERKVVENEDVASALLTFANGVHGSISTSRSAWGRKSYINFEVHGTNGMLTYDQERMNELRIYQNSGPTSEQGFKTILTGPAHAPYGQFVPAAGHQLGFNDLKIIEVRELLQAISEKRQAYPNFADAVQFEEVIHAIAESSCRQGARVEVGTSNSRSKL